MNGRLHAISHDHVDAAHACTTKALQSCLYRLTFAWLMPAVAMAPTGRTILYAAQVFVFG